MCPKKECYASSKIDEHWSMVLDIYGQHIHLQLADSEVEKHEVSQIESYKLIGHFKNDMNHHF